MLHLSIVKRGKRDISLHNLHQISSGPLKNSPLLISKINMFERLAFRSLSAKRSIVKKAFYIELLHIRNKNEKKSIINVVFILKQG